MYELFGILLEFVSSPSFIKPFSHLFMPVWTHSYLFYTLSSNPLLLYLAQIVPAVALSSWLLHSFDELLSILFLSTSLQLGSIRCCTLTLDIYCLRHRVGSLSNHPWFFLLKNDVINLHPGGAHGSLIICPLSRKMYVSKPTYVYTCT